MERLAEKSSHDNRSHAQRQQFGANGVGDRGRDAQPFEDPGQRQPVQDHQRGAGCQPEARQRRGARGARQPVEFTQQQYRGEQCQTLEYDVHFEVLIDEHAADEHRDQRHAHDDPAGKRGGLGRIGLDR